MPTAQFDKSRLAMHPQKLPTRSGVVNTWINRNLNVSARSRYMGRLVIIIREAKITGESALARNNLERLQNNLRSQTEIVD